MRVRRAIRRFRSLPGREKRLVLQAMAQVLVVRATLRVLPFALAVGLLNRWMGFRVRKPHPPERVEASVAAIERVARGLFPRNPCLTSAVAAHLLRRRNGEPATLRIGIRRGSEDRLEAHAWVELHGRIVVGGADSPSSYVALPALTASDGLARG